MKSDIFVFGKLYFIRVILNDVEEDENCIL